MVTCDGPMCPNRSATPARFGWMRVWKVGHKDDAKWLCPDHQRRGDPVDRPLRGKPGPKPKERVDTWRRPQGQPIE